MSQQGPDVLDLPDDVLINISVRLQARDVASLLSTTTTFWLLAGRDELLAQYLFNHPNSPSNSDLLNRRTCNTHIARLLRKLFGSGLWLRDQQYEGPCLDIIKWLAEYLAHAGDVGLLDWVLGCDSAAFQPGPYVLNTDEADSYHYEGQLLEDRQGCTWGVAASELVREKCIMRTFLSCAVRCSHFKK